METLERPIGVSFFCILCYQEEDILFEVKQIFEKRFSKIMYESSPLSRFTLDDYEKEIAYPNNRSKVLSFKQRIHREEIVEKKKECLDVQNLLQKKDPSVLIVPGYVTAHNVVITKSKDDFHRIYLFQGVYAEAVYSFTQGKLNPHNTAPNFFKEKDVVYFFTTLRESYEFNKFKN
ncbi:DUF4416 family protein [Leptospira sp. 96542]|nr:DUF4416 family protein [Leptospira sp. 96542]